MEIQLQYQIRANDYITKYGLITTLPNMDIGDVTVLLHFRYNPITLRWEPYREQSILKTITAIAVVIITVSNSYREYFMF